ncbi:hypothetical protein [Paenibacillus silvae]|nr:hypothetical protein [Paenibacillus silvae]
MEEAESEGRDLRKLGMPAWLAYQWENTRQGFWRIAGSAVLNRL